MPQKRLIVPPARKMLKPAPVEILVATTNVPYPVTAGADTDILPTGNPSIGFGNPLALVLESGNNSEAPVTGTVDVNMDTRIIDKLRRNATGVMLISSCPTERRNGIG